MEGTTRGHGPASNTAMSCGIGDRVAERPYTVGSCTGVGILELPGRILREGVWRRFTCLARTTGCFIESTPRKDGLAIFEVNTQPALYEPELSHQRREGKEARSQRSFSNCNELTLLLWYRSEPP